MSNTRFLIRNILRASEGAYIVNGDGAYTDVVARNEIAPFVHERVQDGDRETLWRSAGASPIVVDFDLSSVTSNSVSAWAVLGRAVGESHSLTVYSRPTYDGNALDWTARSGPYVFNAMQRDGGASFSTTTDDFLRFSWFIGTITVGELWAGPVVDLGFQHSPSSQSSPHRNRVEQKYPDGSVVINELGYNGRDVRLLFAGVRDSMRATLEALSDVSGTFVYLDPLDRAFEVYLPDGAVNVEQNFIDNFTVEVGLVRVP